MIEAYIENFLNTSMPYLICVVSDFEKLYNDGIKLGIALDLARSNIIEDTEEYFQYFPKRIMHIHASDNNGEGDRHLSVGLWSIDWRMAERAG